VSKPKRRRTNNLHIVIVHHKDAALVRACLDFAKDHLMHKYQEQDNPKGRRFAERYMGRLIEKFDTDSPTTVPGERRRAS
jgi:hypothetical protein